VLKRDARLLNLVLLGERLPQVVPAYRQVASITDDCRGFPSQFFLNFNSGPIQRTCDLMFAKVALDRSQIVVAQCQITQPSKSFIGTCARCLSVAFCEPHEDRNGCLAGISRCKLVGPLFNKTSVVERDSQIMSMPLLGWILFRKLF